VGVHRLDRGSPRRHAAVDAVGAFIRPADGHVLADGTDGRLDIPDDFWAELIHYIHTFSGPEPVPIPSWRFNSVIYFESWRIDPEEYSMRSPFWSTKTLRARPVESMWYCSSASAS